MTCQRVTLGEVAEFINGVAFKPVDWEDTGKRIIRIQNLNDPSKPFNRTTCEVDSKYHVHPGDILVSWSASLGVFEWKEPDTALVNQHIFRVLPKLDRVDKVYLRHMLIDALEDMERHLHGATMKHVNRREFLATKIPLPPLAEQKRIAGILDAADALRAKRRESLAQLDMLIQATFLEMFGDPVANPKGWDESPVAAVCESPDDIKCGPFGTQLQQHEFQESGVPLWGIKHVNAGFAVDTDEFVSSKKASKLRQYSIEAGDIVMTRKGTIGKCHVFPVSKQPGIMHSDLLRLRVDPRRASPEFIASQFMLSRKIRRQLEMMSPGAVMPGINVTKLKKLDIEIPPVELQNQYADRLKKIRNEIGLADTHRHVLDDLFASLQAQAFAGGL
ncbi:MAG: restriction endonuclease subunit S [Phycisphaerales bacterium JB065]